MSNDQVLMPFGKHQGKAISALPDKYIRWLHANVELYGDVKRAVHQRLGMPMIVELTEEEKIDQAVQTTIEKLIEAMGE